MKNHHLYTLFTLIFFLIHSGVYANYTSKLEQQINIIDQEYITTSTSLAPTDNSLGLIFFDDDRYTGYKVYFEAVVKCVTCSGGNQQVTAGLYDASANLVSSSTVSTTETDFQLIRSAEITSNITDDTAYSVRLKVDATTGVAYIRSAKLIILQDAENILKTQTQIEMGNNTSITSNTATLIPGPKIFHYDESAYSGVSGIYFEASLTTSDAAATVNATLSSSADCSTSVENSQRSVTGTSWTRSRSDTLSLTNNTDYWVCLSASSGYTGYISNAKLIIDQEEAGGLNHLELYHQLVNTTVIDNDDSYTSQAFPNSFNPSAFVADLKTVYFESATNTTGGTGYTRLFNLTDSTTVSNSEVSTGNSGYTRLRSANIYPSLSSTTKTYDVQLRNSASNITAQSGSWLIIDLDRILDPAISFTISEVGASTTNNGITTSEASTYNSLPFAHLQFQTPKYVAHRLFASTNAVSGYTVTMKMLNYLQGLYPANNIDPFTGSWSSPAVWTSPTGTTPNDNTGWLGANTTDTRVSGWTDAVEKFGAVTNSQQMVMYSGGADSGTTVYVTYAMEVNILQPADEYQGSLVYHFLPTY